MIVLVMVVALRPLRSGLIKMVDGTPAHWLTGIHMVRILALGAVIKAAHGLFPEMFAWYVGIPDFLFGLSAVLLTLRGRLRPPRRGMLIAWNFLGAMVILLPVNGLMHRYMDAPLFEALFMFPMALAPTFLVPTLVMLNLLVAWRMMVR